MCCDAANKYQKPRGIAFELQLAHLCLEQVLNKSASKRFIFIAFRFLQARGQELHFGKMFLSLPGYFSHIVTA